MKISKIVLYDEPTVPEIQVKKLERFLKETFPVEIEIRVNFFKIQVKKYLKKLQIPEFLI